MSQRFITLDNQGRNNRFILGSLAEAQAEAEDQDQEFPNDGPHTIYKLVEVRPPSENGMPPELAPAELRDEGYLLEANRRFFHPLGLALAVDLPVDDEDFEPRVLVYDDRDDPEGWRYDTATLNSAEILDKIENVADLERARRAPRMQALGYWTQEPG